MRRGACMGVDMTDKSKRKTPRGEASQLNELNDIGVDLARLEAAKEGPTDPYTKAGVVGLLDYTTPQMQDASILGLSVPAKNKPPMVVRRPNDFHTQAHEYEHALMQQSGRTSRDFVHEFIRELNAKGRNGDVDVANIVNGLIQNKDHLVKNWGLPQVMADESYFGKGAAGRTSARLLPEMFASLSALEQQTGKRLVDDPVIREKVLNTPEKRAAYDAFTGLRQTRLDARDLPPYTLQAEKSLSFIDRVKELLSKTK